MNKKELLNEIEDIKDILENMGETLYANDEELETEYVLDVLEHCKKYIKEN